MERPPPLRLIRGTESAAAAAPVPPLEIAALGTGLVLIAVLLARLGSWAGRLGTFQSLFAVAFASYALALRGAMQLRTAPHAALTVFAVALAARLALLPVLPTLSDDLYRYVWEGRVAAAGADPYRSSPLDPALAGLRDRTIFPRVNHPELASIYPPLSIAGFALVAKLSATVWSMKLWVLLHDLALVALLLAWLRRSGSPLLAIAYAWNPLVLVEFAGSGHNDPTAIVWLVAALILAEKRPTASALALAAGALTKLAPLAALPLLLPRWPWRARLVALVTVGLGLGWFWLETRGAASGLTAYWRTWRNNDLAFEYLARATGSLTGAKIAALAIVSAVMAFTLARRWPAPAATRATLRAGFLVSPVAHPWYLSWVVALEPPAPSAPWILLSLTAVLSYGVLAPPAEGARFHLALGWRWLEYGAPLLLGVALRVGRHRSPPGS